MKVLAKKVITIKVESTTWEMIKKPKERNMGKRNVSVSEEEKSMIGPHDVVNLEVHDEGGNVVAQNTYTSQSFHRNCNPRTKLLWNERKIRYYILGY